MELAFAAAEGTLALAMWFIAFNGYRGTGRIDARVKMWLALAAVAVTAVIIPNMAVELFDFEAGARAILIAFATVSLFLLTAWFLLGGLRRKGSTLPGQRLWR